MYKYIKLMVVLTASVAVGGLAAMERSEIPFPKKGDYQEALNYVKRNNAHFSELAQAALVSFITREGRLPRNSQEMRDESIMRHGERMRDEFWRRFRERK